MQSKCPGPSSLDQISAFVCKNLKPSLTASVGLESQSNYRHNLINLKLQIVIYKIYGLFPMDISHIIIISLFVGYFWTGWEMVHFHSISHPIDRPSYVRRGVTAKVISMHIWPIVTKMNQELGWYIATFLGSASLLGIILYYAIPFGAPVWAIIGAVPLLRLLPFTATVVNIPIALITTLIFFICFRPFGAKMPVGLDRI